MALGYEGRLYMLAFDHRDAFRDILAPERIPEAKRVIFEGLLRALDAAPQGAPGILIDEEFGADIAREAKAAGLVVAMPVERAGTDEFDFAYGKAYREHIAAFDPTFAKALVRYDPGGDRPRNLGQEARLRELSDWLRGEGRKLLLEVLVPGERSPERIRAAMRALQEAGVEPDVWKVEGLDRRQDCLVVSEQARSGGREGVVCIVLGGGADADTVARWLECAAAMPGYAGFAVGRTIWWPAITGWARGELTSERAAEAIAASYRRLAGAYAGSAQPASGCRA